MENWVRCLLGMGIAISTVAAAGCNGCAEGDSTPGNLGNIDLAYQTGANCEEGCAAARAMLVGTEERLRVTGDFPVANLHAKSNATDVLVAWFESSSLCCAAKSCRTLSEGEPCSGRQTLERMLVLRALRPGPATVTLFDDQGNAVDSASFRVAQASDIGITSAGAPFVRLPDIMESLLEDWNPAFESSAVLPTKAGESAAQSGARREWLRTDGQVHFLAIRVGTTYDARIELRAQDGEPLQASTGIGSQLSGLDLFGSDVLALQSENLLGDACSARFVEGSTLKLRGRAVGYDILLVSAGGLARLIPVVVLPACEGTDCKTIDLDAIGQLRGPLAHALPEGRSETL